MPTATSVPVLANYSSENLTIGAGVAIFHLRTQRVVVCYHTREKYWFLPKGRKNANESIERAAEREGFEETGYLNRLLPLPLRHRQTHPDEGHENFVTEATWIQLLPLNSRKQYLLFWFIAETVPPSLEPPASATNSDEPAHAAGRRYTPPAAFPKSQTLDARIAEENLGVGDGKSTLYEPIWHEGTGVNEDELCYKSYLLPLEDACKKLRGSIMEDVVRKGWEGIQFRLEMERGDAASETASPII